MSTAVGLTASSGAASDDALARSLLLAFAVNPTGTAVVTSSPDGSYRTLALNPAMRALLDTCGIDAESGLPVQEMLSGPANSGPYSDGWRERCHPTPGGHEEWVRWHAAELDGTSEGDRRVLLQADVITDRVRARLQGRRQTRLLDLIPEPVIIRALDGTILYWNRGAADIYGYPMDMALGRRTHDLLHTEFDGVTLPELEQQLAETGVWRGTLRHRHADGHVLNMSSKHVRDDHGDGQPVILEVNIDVTERVHAERALVASEAKFRSQFAHSTVGQLIRHVDGTIEEVNDALADMLGYRPDELVGVSVDRIFSPTTADLRHRAVAAMVSGECESAVGEATLTRSDGSLLDAEVSVSAARGPDGTVERIVGVFQDITARKVAEHALTYQASHDQLTGLANRALIIDRIGRALDAARVEPLTVGLLYLDLDGFKAVNDTYGHHAGDELLTEVAHRLTECVRGGDTIARIGGDEFVVLCPDLDVPARLQRVAERVLTKLRAPYFLDDCRVDSVSASVGMSYPTPAVDAMTALRDADQAMLEVKRSGKNKIGLHLAPDMDDEAPSAGSGEPLRPAS